MQFKTNLKLSIVASEGRGSVPDMTSKHDLHRGKSLRPWMRSVCDFKSGIDPRLSLARSCEKCLYFLTFTACAEQIKIW